MPGGYMEMDEAPALGVAREGGYDPQFLLDVAVGGSVLHHPNGLNDVSKRPS